MMFRQFRLWIERIDLARRTVHKQEHDMLGLRREVRCSRRERTSRIQRLRGGRGHLKEPSARKQIDQRQPREPAANLPEKFTASAPAGRGVANEARMAHRSF